MSFCSEETALQIYKVLTDFFPVLLLCDDVIR